MRIFSKRRSILPSWIAEHLKDFTFKSLYDPFSRAGAVCSFFKRKGHRVIANDLALCFYWWNKGAIENNGVLLMPSDIQMLCKQSKESVDVFEDWRGSYFTSEEIHWLRIWRKNISRLTGESQEAISKQALAFIAVFKTINYWLSFRLFGLKGKSFSPQEAFQFYVNQTNSLVFNNYLKNEVHNQNALSLTPLIHADVMFFYPPTPSGYDDSDPRFLLWERWIREKPEFHLGDLIGRDKGKVLGQFFKDGSTYLEAMDSFLSRAGHFRIWIISYNKETITAHDEINRIIKKYKKIEKEAEIKFLAPERSILERLIIAK